MRASDREMTVCDRHNELCDTEVDARVERWLNCGRCAVSLSRDVRAEVHCPIV